MSEPPAIARIDLQPVGGIAGDMFAASVFSAFPHLYKDFCSDLLLLGVDGLSTTLEDRLSGSLQAKYFDVVQHTAQKPPRTLTAVKEFLREKPLNKSIIEHAIGIFTLLAQAEAEVHGKTIDTIHFHEVSDWDSIVDIVAAAGIIARLECDEWRIGVLPIGGGTVNTAHGEIPVPAPATVALLSGFQMQDDGVAGERVTPTGAAILAYIKATPMQATTDAASLHATGSGCGTKELPGRANILRVTAFATSTDQPAMLCDEVVRIAFEVDDMTAEEIAWASDKLRETEGVLDVAAVVMQGKKGRVAIGIRIVTSVERANAVVSRCFSVTSTIGIRHEFVQRYVLSRSEKLVDHADVKVVSRPAAEVTAKASSDGLAAAETLSQRRRCAEQRSAAALKLE